MDDELMQKWIDAGIRLAENPDEKVSCPCGCDSFLSTEDVRDSNDSSQFERYMICKVCDASNVLRMSDD
ncbi:MAG: hypothetical protein AAF431_11155 [Pseudomonadota bacterium]